MVFDELLSLNDQRLVPLLADQDDRDRLGRRIDVEQDPVVAEQTCTV